MPNSKATDSEKKGGVKALLPRWGTAILLSLDEMPVLVAERHSAVMETRRYVVEEALPARMCLVACRTCSVGVALQVAALYSEFTVSYFARWKVRLP